MSPSGLYLSVNGSPITSTCNEELIWYFGGFVISREASTAQDATVWPGFAADVRHPRLDTCISPRNSALTLTGPQSQPRPQKPSPAQKMDLAIK